MVSLSAVASLVSAVVVGVVVAGGVVCEPGKVVLLVVNMALEYFFAAVVLGDSVELVDV